MKKIHIKKFALALGVFALALVSNKEFSLNIENVNAASGQPVEIHVSAVNQDFNQISVGISDGNTGARDINSFGTPTTEGTLSASLPGAVAFGFDGAGTPTEYSTPFSLITMTGARTTVALSDDQVSADITLPFDVTMFGRANNAIRISSNGFIYLNQTTVSETNSRCCAGQLMSVINTTNDHAIAGGWTDLYPPGNGEISYETFGVAPSRTFVVQFDNVSQCCNANGGNTFQIQLYEVAPPPPPPDAITDLAATEGNQEVSLTWTAPNDNGSPITSYEVHYSNDGFATNDQTCTALDCTDTTTGATVTGLTNGTNYSFRVYAINANGTSNASNTVTATPSLAIVQIHVFSSNNDFSNIATGISDGNNGSQDINAFGTPTTEAALNALLPDAVGYRFDGVGTPTQSSIPYNPLTLTAPTSVSLADDQVSADITIPFTVNMFGRNNDTIRISSNGFIYLNQGTVNNTNARCCSGQLMSSFGDSNDHLIAGTWTDMYPPGAGTISYQTLGTSPSRTFVVEFNNISPCCDATGGNTFQIQLFENGTGGGGGTTPDAIIDLKVQGQDQQATLSWTAPADGGDPLTSYEVHYSTDGFATDDQTCVSVDCTDLTTGATITGLTNNTIYSFRVYSINGVGTSPVSNTVLTWPGTISGSPAQWPSTAAPEDVLVSSDPDPEDYPQIIHTSDGNFIVIFNRFINAEGETSIFVQKINATDGSAMWPSPVRATPEVGISHDINTGHFTPDNNGGAFIAWTENVSFFPNFHSNIFVQKIDGNGNVLWGNGINVTTDEIAELGEGSPFLLNDANGGIYVGWNIVSGGFTLNDNYITHLDSTGTVDANWNTGGTGTFRTVHIQNSLSENESQIQNMWFQADNNVAVAFPRFAGTETTGDVIVVNQNGTSLGPNIQITNSGENIGQFKAYPYGNYGIYGLFGVNGNVNAQRINDAGVKEWGANGLIVSAMDGDYINAVNDGSDGLLISWNYYEGFDGSDVYAQHVLPNGTLDPSWGGDINVTPNGDGYSVGINNYRSDMISDGLGGAYIAIISTGDETVRVQHINSDGTISFGGSGYSLGSISQGADNFLSMTSGTSGKAATAWCVYNAATWCDIYAQYFYFTPPGPVPDAITDLTATSGDQSASLTWTAPNDNGSPITDYIIQYNDGSGYQTFTDGTNTNTNVTVTGLTNYTNYSFRVYSINANGQSASSNIATTIPVPCGAMRSNEQTNDNPLTTVSDQCIGISLSGGGLSLPYVPDSFSFPRKFSSSTAQNSFSNDNPATRPTVDVSIGSEDVLSARDLTGSDTGFEVTLSSSTFASGANTLPLNGLYVVTTAPDSTTLNTLDASLNGTTNNPNQIVYASGSTGTDILSSTATTGDLDLASTYTTDGVSFDVNNDTIANSVSLMSAPAGTTHMLTASQALSFYQNIPASQASGTYSVIFTVDIFATPVP